MLTLSIKNALELNNYIFFYLPHFPLQWEPDFSKVYLSKSRLSWIVWSFNIAAALMIGVGNVYVVYTHFFVANRPYFNYTHAFIFVAGGVFVFTITSLSSMLLLKRKQLVAGFNFALSLDRDMTRGN